MITQESGFKSEEVVDVFNIWGKTWLKFSSCMRVFPTAISIRKWRYSECDGKGRNIGGERGSNWMESNLACVRRAFQTVYIYIYVTVLPPEICALVLFFFSLPAFFSTECNSERRNLYFRIENCAPMKTVTSGGWWSVGPPFRMKWF